MGYQKMQFMWCNLCTTLCLPVQRQGAAKADCYHNPVTTVTKQLRNWFGNVQHFEFVNDTRMASFLCRREKGGGCIQDLSLSVVKILLFNKSPITTPFVNKCQKWFSWLTKAWGWWGRWWVAGKVKLVTTGSTCLEAKLSYISLSEAFSRLFYFISSPRAFLQFELYY